MDKRESEHQSTIEVVSIEGLVPKDHLPRKIDNAIKFIFDKVKELYCPQ